MSRVFLDDDLESWEVYASGGEYGKPERPKIVFFCRTRPTLRARYLRHPGDNVDAAALVQQASGERLRELFGQAAELG